MSTPLTPPTWVESVTSRADPSQPYVRIFKCTVFVRDQNRSLRFYMDQLGFKLVADVAFTPTGRWVALAPPDGSTLIILLTPKPDSAEMKLMGTPSEVAFITDDVVKTYQAWSARGVKFSEVPKVSQWGGTSTRFEDPDGNSFILLGFDESTRQIEEQRRAIADRQEFERRSAQEIGIAKQVQARLFPQNQPLLSTLDYAGVCIQARAVGGDYFDFLNLGREHVGLVTGDIAGKGIGGALLMANLQANVRSQCAIAVDHPQRFLQSVNQLFFDSTSDGAYATLFFAEYNDRERRLRYANCGHLPALVMRGDGNVERLESTATVVGLFQNWDCGIGEKTLRPGDTLALYTDGITEAFGENGEEFGERRLVAALEKNRKLRSADLLDAVVNDVHAFAAREQSDDITLIVAQCK
jgi:serine phosphatase RsbU (regulator of sigma subunit)/catechol 2,3-dioxygenase-like lactoylglutathione lyase family enzyme